jgi:hypothetical protein
MGVYALERMPIPRARETLERIVARLAEVAVRQERGLAWQWDDRVINLGVAHGVPAILTFLAGAARWGIDVSALRTQAMEWYWSLHDENLEVRFPTHVLDGKTVCDEETIPGWCYGAPALAASFLAGAHALGSNVEEQRAIDLGRHASRWDPATLPSFLTAGTQAATDWLENPFLCHGSAVRGHALNRVYQHTRDEAIARAARAWFARTVAQRRPSEGFGGFSRWVDEKDWEEAGFIFGVSGVALALLAAATSIEPRWDRLLMFSLALPDQSQSTA